MNPTKIFFRKIASYKVLIVSILFIACQLPVHKSFAEDEKQATLKLFFEGNDSLKTCKAVAQADNKPLNEKDVHFYVKRLFSLLPIGKAVQTNENGEAVITFPNDLPGDKDANLMVIAKIEDDDTYGTVETKAEVKWGVLHNPENDHWGNRSLSASREKAPTYLIIVSNLIIAVIWGTIFYVVYQIFRIRKESRILNKK